MSKASRVVYNVGKGIYDIFATYLLLWVLYITAVSMGLHAIFSLLAAHLDFETLELMWIVVGRKLDVDPLWVRLVIYGALQVSVLWLLYKPLRAIFSHFERVFDWVQRKYLWFGAKFPRFKKAFGICFSLVVTALLVPFVVQPTLVGPMQIDARSMAERAANLADGQATLGFADSVVGFYRRLYEKPDPIGGVPKKDLDRIFAEEDDKDSEGGKGHGTLPSIKNGGKQPMMDRWDPYIWEAAGKNPEQFAFIKAFMWVESGGRQFAVSHTGCMGLMQFCAGTARRAPFDKIFGTGQVYRCKCDGPCRIERDIQRDMEQGDVALIEAHVKSKAFPCEVTDARLNGAKAIRAGGAYVESLSSALGGNIYLMYIGYNSGPAVARKVYARLGKKPDATLEEIEVHLAASMEKWYGDKSERRARSLIRTHLPKIKKAYDRYHASTQAQKSVVQCEPPRAPGAPMMHEDTPPEVAALIDELMLSGQES